MPSASTAGGRRKPSDRPRAPLRLPPQLLLMVITDDNNHDDRRTAAPPIAATMFYLRNQLPCIKLHGYLYARSRGQPPCSDDSPLRSVERRAIPSFLPAATAHCPIFHRPGLLPLSCLRWVVVVAEDPSPLLLVPTFGVVLVVVVLRSKTPPTPCLWQASASTQKTKKKTRPAIRRSARW